MIELMHIIDYLHGLQDRICNDIALLDGKSFVEDRWQREEGGGGRSRC